MAELPVLPLKTDALLADTTHMSPEEFGIYCRLLFVMWRHGGMLKDDDFELATIGGVPLSRWRKIKEKVMRPMLVAGGMVSQKRLTDTWMRVQEVRAKKAGAAETRWKGKHRPRAMHMHDQAQSGCNTNQMPNSILTSLEDRPSSEPWKHLHGGSLATALPTGALRDPPIDNRASGQESLAEEKTRFRISNEALTAIGGGE